MHVRCRLTVLALGAVTIIILGTAKGQAPVPTPSAIPPATAKAQATVAAAPKAQANFERRRQPKTDAKAT